MENQTGYFACCAAINRALNEGTNITSAEFLSKLTIEQLEHILRSDDGDTKAPLLQERVDCLHQVSSKLLEKYDGKFENVVIAANGVAQKLLQLIVEEFPCFRDEAVYKGQRVSIYKRAQILIGDVYACFQGDGIGHFEDLNETITMFADYRVPQVLVHFGALVYNEELTKDLKSGKLLENGEPKEVEVI